MAHVTDPQWLTDGEHRWLVFSWHASPAEWQPTLERLKELVPADCRQWDPDRKVWSVREDFVPLLLDVFSNLRGSLEAMESQGALF